MTTPRSVRLLLATAGALAVAGGAVVITAQAAGFRFAPVAATSSSAPTNSPTIKKDAAGDACTAYFKHLSDRLGIKDQAKVQKAASDAVNDTIKDQVAKGTLTQAQADKIAVRTKQGPLCSGAAFGGQADRHGPRGPHVMGGYIDAAAAALNLTPEALRKDLKEGQTLSQVAGAQHVSEDDFKARVRASIKARLDPQVAAGKLSQAQEDKMLDHLTAGDPPLWNKLPAKP